METGSSATGHLVKYFLFIGHLSCTFHKDTSHHYGTTLVRHWTLDATHSKMISIMSNLAKKSILSNLESSSLKTRITDKQPE